MRVLLTSIFLVLALPALTARADDEAAALAHLDKGVAAFRAGDFTLAHVELSQARDLAPAKPNPYRWLALTEIQLGDCADALVDIDSFLVRVRADDPRTGEMTRLRELCRRGAVQPNLRLDHDVAHPAPDPMFGAQDRPAQPTLTQRWWFWPTIGIVALAVTGTTIYVATHDSETTLPTIHCTSTGCTP